MFNFVSRSQADSCETYWLNLSNLCQVSTIGIPTIGRWTEVPLLAPAMNLHHYLLRWIRRLDMTSSVPYQPISPTHAGLQSASFLAILHLPLDDRWIKIALGKPWQNILTTLSTASRSGSEKLWLCLAFFLGLWISLEGFWCFAFYSLHMSILTVLHA